MSINSPRLLPVNQIDLFSFEAFRHDPAWATDNAATKLSRLFQWFAASSQAIADGGDTFSDQESSIDFGRMTDPLWLLNITGYASPATRLNALAVLWQQLGGTARLVSAGAEICGCEFQLGDKWVFATLEPSALWLSHSDKSWSAADLKTNDAAPPILLPADAAIEPALARLRSGDLSYHLATAPADFTGDCHLIRGTQITWFRDPPEPRWLCDARALKDKPWAETLAREPVGPKSEPANQRLFSLAKIIFNPFAAELGDDWATEAESVDNIHRTEAGLTLQEAGDGVVILAFESPGPFVPIVGKLNDAKDDAGAVILEADGKGLTLQWSPDYGATWLTIDTKKLPEPIDLTKELAGRSRFWLRIALKGKPGESIVGKLTITAWSQVSPGSIPNLKTGTNRLIFRSGDAHGQPTRLARYEMPGSDENGFLKYAIRPPTRQDASAPRIRGLGTIITRLPPWPGCQIHEFTAGAAFTREGSTSQEFGIDWAANSPQNWQPLLNEQWPDLATNGIVQRDVHHKLETPAESIFLRFRGAPGLATLRTTARCKPPTATPPSPITITHRWTENGEPREFTATFNEASEYTIEAGENPSNQSIELRVL
ncbi:MAG: hypothetical protein KF777_07810 [Planctomycetaceae bacterium]|nr:hypothetical protein [Planctomycetaceae bacterium]